MRESQLLVSKLSAPPWRPHWVRRPRVLLPDPAVAPPRLLLCAAPAGFGKTTALIAWADLRRAQAAAVAWYTLDPADNDLARFVAYLLGAFAQADPCLPLAGLRADAGADTEQLLVGLLNLLADADRPFALVLDDYHLIQAHPVHQAVAFLLDRLPPTVQIAIGTRADPPLPLARLRARDQLAELRAADLQFDLPEIQAFFAQRMGLQLSAHALDILSRWTEGWAAGLQLVALALPHTNAANAGVEQIHTHMAGSQRHIFTFLADEVFAQQSAATQAFLLATSVVDHLTPELCDALVKDEGGRMKDEGGRMKDEADPSPALFILHPSSLILEYLEQANLFVVRLDGGRPWYRYHHLFRDFLRRRLDREQPGRRAELHRRAARWYEEMGQITQAVNHALAAGDMPAAADLIVRVAWEQLSGRGEIATILGWVERFPQEQLASSPLLSLSLGQAAFMSEQAATAERFFALAEQGLARAALDDIKTAKVHMKLQLYRSVAALMDGSVGNAEAWLAAVEPILPADDPGMIAGHALAVGLGQLLRGDLAAAYAALNRLEEMARRARHEHFLVDAAQLLALTDMGAGDLACAERRCSDLLASFGSNLPPIPALGVVLARLASVAYYRGYLDQAEQILHQGAQHGRRTSGRAPRQIWQWLVRVKIAQRDQDGLRALLAEDEGRSSTAGGAVLASLMLAMRAEGLLALGAVEEAWVWAQHCDQVRGEHLREVETTSITRVLLAMRRPAEALARLEPLVVAAESGQRIERLIEGLVVQAHALLDLQRTPEALDALRRALALAEPRGFVQIFLDAGPPIAALLRRLRDADERLRPAITQLLAAYADAPQPAARSPQPLIDPLTERELEVLSLLAGGATNQEIADHLVVSVGTVKTHLNHILGKLGARNRTEAVARARDIGLI